MENRSKKYVILLVVIFILIITFGAYFANNIGKSSQERLEEESRKELNQLLKGIKVTSVSSNKATISDSQTSLADELPDISKYPLVVDGKGDINVEIISSTEKSGTGTDGWLNDVARKFNQSNYTIDGKTVSISVRSIASGLGADYIISGKYLPDAYSPSNSQWGQMIQAKNVKIDMQAEKTVENVAGVVISKSKYNNIINKYGEANLGSIIKEAVAGEIMLGYTNPYASASGLNFLISALAYYDENDPVSSKAVEGFKKLQEKIPFVSYTTLQMRDSAEKGTLDAFILEYQTFINDSTLSSSYEFIPYGVEHNNPIYSIGTLSNEKNECLQAFIKYCNQDYAKNLAKQYGFNKYDNYTSKIKNYEGTTLFSAQDVWKEEKDLGKPVVGVFVADISGSMAGTPIAELKSSLINASKYINNNNYVGLISYNSNVYKNLEIGEFNLNQRAYFNGAVQSLSANGQTSTYDAVLVAIDMINKKLEEIPDAKPMIFLLSDGEQNRGNSLEKISGIVENLQIPIYTIGYNANLTELGKLSSINEAASINADSDDVVYQLKNLFNSNL